MSWLSTLFALGGWGPSGPALPAMRLGRRTRSKTMILAGEEAPVEDIMDSARGRGAAARVAPASPVGLAWL